MAIATLWAATAEAGNVYIKGGYGYLSNEPSVNSLLNDSSEFYNAEIGYNLGSVSVGLEGMYYPDSIADGYGVILNAYYHIPKSDMFVSAGIGGIHPKNESIDWSVDNITAVYQVGAGAEISLYGPVSVEPSVGYFSTWNGLLSGDIPVETDGIYANASLKIEL